MRRLDGQLIGGVALALPIRRITDEPPIRSSPKVPMKEREEKRSQYYLLNNFLERLTKEAGFYIGSVLISNATCGPI